MQYTHRVPFAFCIYLFFSSFFFCFSRFSFPFLLQRSREYMRLSRALSFLTFNYPASLLTVQRARAYVYGRLCKTVQHVVEAEESGTTLLSRSHSIVGSFLIMRKIERIAWTALHVVHGSQMNGRYQWSDFQRVLTFGNMRNAFERSESMLSGFRSLSSYYFRAVEWLYSYFRRMRRERALQWGVMAADLGLVNRHQITATSYKLKLRKWCV